jgi:hypothetical protein
MAHDKAAPIFMDLPLEVRHCIFNHAAARDTKPKKLLRYWFEKKEVKENIAQLAVQDPHGPTPRVHWSDDREYGDESDVDEEEDEEDRDEEAEGAEDQDSEDEENEGEAEQDEDEEEDGEDEEEQAEEDQEAEVDEEEEEEDALDGAQVHLLAAAAQVPAPAPASAQPTASAQATTPVDEEEQAEDEMEVDTEEVQDEEQKDEAETQDTLAEVEQESEDEGEKGEEMADDNGSADSTAAPPQQPPRPAPVVQAHRKWRHIPNFMRLTQCPPPVELLLTSQQLNTEAKNWFYDVAVLRIDATGSFAHTSFFEEAFSQITDCAFSPMENIRKVEVTFVWDSTWVRADTSGCVGAIFPALLGQRSSFVYQILSQAPDLKEVVIHW